MLALLVGAGRLSDRKAKDVILRHSYRHGNSKSGEAGLHAAALSFAGMLGIGNMANEEDDLLLS